MDTTTGTTTDIPGTSTRRIVANFFASLDGVVEAPHTWHFPWFDDEMGAAVGKGMASSATLVRWLLREGLPDELNLLVHPVVPGQGHRLFEDSVGEQRLELTACAPLASGVVHLTYRPARI